MGYIEYPTAESIQKIAKDLDIKPPERYTQELLPSLQNYLGKKSLEELDYWQKRYG